MTIHDLDMARFFVPDIVEVSAMGANVYSDDIRSLDDFDPAAVTLRGRSGELIIITNSRHCAFGHDQRLEAFGTNGILAAGNLSETQVRRFGASGTEEATGNCHSSCSATPTPTAQNSMRSRPPSAMGHPARPPSTTV